MRFFYDPFLMALLGVTPHVPKREEFWEVWGICMILIAAAIYFPIAIGELKRTAKKERPTKNKSKHQSTPYDNKKEHKNNKRACK